MKSKVDNCDCCGKQLRLGYPDNDLFLCLDCHTRINDFRKKLKETGISTIDLNKEDKK